jgi:hypothetical protein
VDILATAQIARRLLVSVQRQPAHRCVIDLDYPSAPKGDVPSLRNSHPHSTHLFVGRFNLLAGVAAYAPILAIFGSLSVPAIVLILTVPALGAHPKPSVTIGLATGLLMVGLLGSLLGALAAAAIGAERLPTANLTAAAMFMAVPAMVSVVSILGAFEVLVSTYASTSASLFAVVVGAGGAFGVFFAAFAVADSPGLGPSDPEAHRAWLQGQRLRDRKTARNWALSVAIAGIIPIAIAVGLWLSKTIIVALTPDRNNALVGLALGLAIFFTGWSEIRATHAIVGEDRGLRLPEAFLSCIAIGIYSGALVIFLPHH